MKNQAKTAKKKMKYLSWNVFLFENKEKMFLFVSLYVILIEIAFCKNAFLHYRRKNG